MQVSSLLIPDSLSLASALLLLGLSMFTSMLTACLGAGGGVLMLIALSFALPPAAIIPVHGCIQLGSNVGRCSMASTDIDWSVVRGFVPAALLGTVLAGLVLVQLPPSVWQITIALFVLYLCWGPELPAIAASRKGIWAVAAVTGFLTMFVGATGPLVSAYVKQMFEQRRVIVATVAAILSIQHSAKAVTFGLNGFDFLPWFLFIGAMIASGAAGTWVGLHLLGKMNNRSFNRIFNGVLSLLALRLLWQGAQGLTSL